MKKKTISGPEDFGCDGYCIDCAGGCAYHKRSRGNKSYLEFAWIVIAAMTFLLFAIFYSNNV